MSNQLPGRSRGDQDNTHEIITVTARTTSTCNNLVFHGGNFAEQFVKPEESNRALVSHPVNFFPPTVDLKGWRNFSDELGRLLVQNPGELGDYSKNDCCGDLRVVICSPALLNAQLFKRKRGQEGDEEEHDDKRKVVTLPMKLKVVANMPMSLSRAEKEQSCLTKLVRLCGPQNLSWVIEGLGWGNTYPCQESLIKLVWNEEELAFEVLVPLTFRKVDLTNFGNNSGRLKTGVKMFAFRMTYAGVNQVLREIYGTPGQDWRLKQEMLEDGSFADLAIVSENPKDQGTIKCHKVHLASASRVFANMLKESATWEEAKTGTITLPESEDAIRAMVHFIYYGGTDRIFGNRMDVVLELLQAGHKYDLKNLVEVASFVLLAFVDDKNQDKWFTVDAAVELFCFASLQDGEKWDHLKKRSVDFLRMKTKEERMASEGFQRLYQIALKIGPVFGIALDYLGKSFVELTKEEQHLPASIGNVTQEEAKLVFDLWYSDGGWFGRTLNVEILVGMTMLAEYCGRTATELGKHYLWEQSLKRCDLDFMCKLYEILNKMDHKLWIKLNPGIMEEILDAINFRTITEEDGVEIISD